MTFGRSTASWVLPLIFAVSFWCGRARAQVAEAAYSDAKDIISDLITAEVSQAAVPGIACYSGRQQSSAATAVGIEEQEASAAPVKRYRFEAPRHFPRTLQRIYNRQYGTLRATVRDEAASLAAYLVFRGLLAANAKVTGDTATFAVLSEQLSKALDLGPVAPARPTSLDFRPLTSEQRAVCVENTRQLFDSNVFGHQSTYAIDEECAASRAKRRSTFDGYECNVGFAIRASLMEDFAGGEDYLIKAVAGILLDNARLLDNDAAFDATVALLRDFLADPKWDAARFAGLPARLASVSSDLQAVAAVQLATVLAQLPPDIRGGVESVVAGAGDSRAKLAAAEAALALVVSASPAVPAVLAKLPRLRAFASMASQSLAPLLNELNRLPRLHGAWRAAVSRRDGNLSVQEFLNVAREATSGLCSLDSGASCQALEVVGTASWQVTPLVELASRGQYRELAHVVVRYVFQRKLGDEAEESTNVYQRFAESVVMYVLDLSDEKVPSEGTRAAFRAAAVDLLRELGQAGGVKRRAWSVSHWWFIRYPTWKPLLLPDLALRVSWSPTFINEAEGPSRVLASVDFLTLRMPIKRGNIGHFGLQLSFVDPLAPLSELSLRRSTGTDYRNVSRCVERHRAAPGGRRGPARALRAPRGLGGHVTETRRSPQEGRRVDGDPDGLRVPNGGRLGRQVRR